MTHGEARRTRRRESLTTNDAMSWCRRRSLAIVAHRCQVNRETNAAAEFLQLLIRVGCDEKLQTTSNGPGHSISRVLLSFAQQGLGHFDCDLSRPYHVGQDIRIDSGTSARRLPVFAKTPWGPAQRTGA